MRQIVLDTETTGLDPKLGHRIIEIGCIELINRQITNNTFHCYLNPEKTIDAGAIAVHGLTNDFLSDKKKFRDIANDFIQFIDGAELIIHNAAFDVGFLDAELSYLIQEGMSFKSIAEYCSVLDTLLVARKKNPRQRNSLDALCRRYGIDNSHRELHGALLDAKILADVYIAMTGGQVSFEFKMKSNTSQFNSSSISSERQNKINHSNSTIVIQAIGLEIEEHEKLLQRMQKLSGTQPIWRN
ncbi:MAG: DNA polymerase III subunit epsilon [Pseudomonadota bacterium]